MAVGAINLIGTPGVFQRPRILLQAQGEALTMRANAESKIANAIMGGGDDENAAIFELFQASALNGLLQNFLQASIERAKEFMKSLKSIMDLGISN